MKYSIWRKSDGQASAIVVDHVSADAALCEWAEKRNADGDPPDDGSGSVEVCVRLVGRENVATVSLYAEHTVEYHTDDEGLRDLDEIEEKP